MAHAPFAPSGRLNPTEEPAYKFPNDARRHLSVAITSLQRIVVDKCDGADGFNNGVMLDTLRKVFHDLLLVRDMYDSLNQ